MSSRPVSFTCLFLVPLLMSCGKPLLPPKSNHSDPQEGFVPALRMPDLVTPLPSPLTSGVPPVILRLDPRIIYSSPEVDAPAAQSRIWFEEEGIWHARSAIPIHGGLEPFFLTWNQTTETGVVENAFYSFERESARGSVWTDPERRNPSWSEPSQRWYIPLRALLPSDPNLIDGSDIYRVNLELHLRERSPVRATVEFRIAPPIPVVRRMPAPIGIPFSGVSAQRAFAADGALEALVDEIENPSQQALSLWIGPVRTAALGFGLRHVSHSSLGRTVNGQLAIQEHVEEFQSRTELRLDRIRVQPENEPTTEVALRTLNSGYTRITLGPRQKLRLSWLASLPDRGAAQGACSLPVEVPESFYWSDLSEECHSTPHGGVDVCHTHGGEYRAERRDAWSLSAVKLAAVAIPEVFVTAGSFTDADWQEFLTGRSSLYAYGLNTRSAVELPAWGSPFASSTPLATCQGLY